MQLAVMRAAMLVVATVGLAACGGGEDSPAAKPPSRPETSAVPPAPKPSPPAASPETAPEPVALAAGDAAAGEPVYVANCATCHGPRGDGDGPLSQTLEPKPAKHSDGAYMNALDDAYLVRVIREGGAAVGKSPLMAPWAGTLSDQQIADVAAFVRSLADPPYEPPGG